MKREYHNWSGEYEKSYEGSSYNKDERSHSASREVNNTPPEAPRRVEPTPPPTPPTPPPTQKKKRTPLSKNPFFIWLLLVLVTSAFGWIMNVDTSDMDEQTEETIDDPWSTDDMDLDEDLQPVPDDANDVTNDATNDVTIDASDSPESDSPAIAPEDDDAIERSTHTNTSE